MERSSYTIESPGFIQMLVVAFPGNRFKGEILPELDRLKSDAVIRVIDLLIVRKDAAGNVLVATASDLDWDEATALGSYLGALAGLASAGAEGLERGALAGAAAFADGHLFDEEDVFRVKQVLGNDMSAALALIEHVWSRQLRRSIGCAEGIELLNEWVRQDELFTAGRSATEEL
jgi:uncharacterized membrane protein